MHGANMFKRDNTGRNSFHLAVSTGNNRLVQHFLSLIDFEENIVHLPDAYVIVISLLVCFFLFLRNFSI